MEYDVITTKRGMDSCRKSGSSWLEYGSKDANNNLNALYKLLSLVNMWCDNSNKGQGCGCIIDLKASE